MNGHSTRQGRARAIVRNGLTVVALLGALGAAPAWPQISNVSVATNPGNYADSASSDGLVMLERRSQVGVQGSGSTSLSTRYAATVDANGATLAGFPPSPIPGTITAGHDYTVQFKVTAPAGTPYRLLANTSRVGDLNVDDHPFVGCIADVVTGVQSGGTLISGSLDLPYVEAVGSPLVLSQSASATIEGTGTGSAVSHSLTFQSAAECHSWLGPPAYNASLRLGLAPSTYIFATGSYPGTPARNAATDGHFVNVTLEYCGDGTQQVALGEQCDQGSMNGLDSCCTATCQLVPMGNTCRNPVDGCDPAEVCDGSSPECPADIVGICTPTSTSTETPTLTPPVDTATPVPGTSTPTLTYTATPVPGTSTATPIPGTSTPTLTPLPTDTAMAPPSTSTSTPTPVPTDTATAAPSTPTSTVPPPTNTQPPTLTPTRTATAVFTATLTFTATPAAEAVTATVGPATPVTTDPENDGATVDDPIETSVSAPGGGAIGISETSTGAPPVSGYGVLGEQIEISAPAATFNAPLQLIFVIADELVPDGTESTLQVTRAEPSAMPPVPPTILPDCTGNPGEAVPDPCIANRTVLPDGDVQITVLTSHASLWAVVAPHHDSVVLAPKPILIKAPRDQHVVSKKLRVRVTNADILPSKESGHTVKLQADLGDCPAGTLAGQPDFDTKLDNAQPTATLKGGQTKTAVVPLSIDPVKFPQAGPKEPARCTLQLSASSEVDGNVEPSPANNVVAVELNVINPVGSGTVAHESVLQSQVPVRVAIKPNATSATKNVKARATNADGSEATHDIAVSVLSSDCPGTVVPPSFANGQPQTAVAAGKTAAATLSVSPDGTLLSPNSKSPARCTVVLQVTTEVPANSEANSSNNTTRLVVDVVDKNDF